MDIDYVLDQYTGIFGNYVLPPLSPSGERSLPAWVKRVFLKPFTLDSIITNKTSGDFYDKATEIDRNISSSKYSKVEQTQYALISRFLGKQTKAVGDLNDEIKEVLVSTLTDAEKEQKILLLKAAIIGIQENALEALPKYEAAVKRNLRVLSTDEKAADREIDRAYLMANKDAFGAEYAIEILSKDRYAKAQEAAMQGISYDSYFSLFFANTPDTDGNGSISQDEMREALDKTALSKSQKAFLFAQQNMEWKNNPYKG
jgi:hypothetical protein